MRRWVVLLNGDSSQRMSRPQDGSFTGVFALLAAAGGTWQEVAEFDAETMDECLRVTDILAPDVGGRGGCKYRRPNIKDLDVEMISRHRIVIPSQATA